MKGLSNQQRKVYDFIAQYHAEQGISPSIADVAKGAEIAPTTAQMYINALKTKGYVTSKYGVPRSLKVVAVGM